MEHTHKEACDTKRKQRTMTKVTDIALVMYKCTMHKKNLDFTFNNKELLIR